VAWTLARLPLLCAIDQLQQAFRYASTAILSILEIKTVSQSINSLTWRCFALSVLALSLAACGFDTHEVRQWVLPAKRQSIDLDINHWVPFAFSEGPITVTIKIPPDSRSFQIIKFPQVAFDQYSQRHLLDVEYDYRSKSIEELAEFELQVWFIRLATPLSTSNADTLNRALHVAGRRPPPKDDEPAPELVTANGREWIHLDGTDSHFGGRVGESYGTLIDPQTVFFVIGSYWENIRKESAWLESRRRLLRSVRDNVTVLTP
jgi:hypothetical protein